MRNPCPRGFQSHIICGCKSPMRRILDAQALDPSRQLRRPVPPLTEPFHVD